MALAVSVFKQSFFLPGPTLTEKNIGFLHGKVCLVSGGNSGVGLELCRILYGAGATTFLAGRNEAACAEAITSIRASHPDSTGTIQWLHLDLSDLSGISQTVSTFLSKADRLDYLCNNAGVMGPPEGSKGAQGHELQTTVNCLGAYVLTESLRPILVKTAAAERARGNENVVRVSWAGSVGIELTAPKNGMSFDKGADGVDELHVEAKTMENYATSKTGNLYLAKGWGDEVAKDGIVSVVSLYSTSRRFINMERANMMKCFNPGNLDSNLQRHQKVGIPDWFYDNILRPMLFKQVYGAYTELWCGFSQDLTVADNGRYIAPWGRKWYCRPDIEAARTGEICTKYMDWVRRETKSYITLVK